MSGKYGTPTNLMRVKRRPRQHSKGANICVRCLCQFAKGEWMIPSGMTAWRHGKPCQRTERSVGRSDVCGLCGGGIYEGIDHQCVTGRRKRRPPLIT